jgi:hypothetical protein
MYRLTLFFDARDDAHAGDVCDEVATLCDEVATLCDQLVGRPSSEESRLPYILTFEEDPAEDDEEAQARWVAENVMRPNRPPGQRACGRPGSKPRSGVELHPRRLLRAHRARWPARSQPPPPRSP